MSKKYIGVSDKTLKLGSKYYEYIRVQDNKIYGLSRDISCATMFETEDEAMKAMDRTSAWVCEYDGESIIPLQKTI